MKNKTVSTSFVRLPAGTYTGTLSGYQVDVTVKAALLNAELSVHPSHRITISFETLEGIRGFADCKVKVTNNTAIVEW